MAEVTRRNFLTKAGLATLGTAVAGTALAGYTTRTAHADEAEASDDDFSTEYTADVLVVGTGVAGFSAAISAIESGVAVENVLVVDKVTGEGADYAGSSMVMGGNYIYASDGSEEGIEAFAQAMLDMTGGVQDEDLIRVLAENANTDLEWLIGLGCEFGEDVEVGAGSSYEAASARSMEGAGTAANLRSAYEDMGGQIVWNCRVVSLLTGPSGVCGVICNGEDGLYQISAKKVVLATGGICSSAYWKERLFGEFGGFIYSRAPESITGDGYALVESVGGTLAPFSHGKKALYGGVAYPGVVSSMASAIGGLAKNSLCINGDGERFVDEANFSTQDNMRSLLEQPKCLMAVLSDAAQLENNQTYIEKLDGFGVPTYTFDTLDEVADLIGCDAETLSATVAEYNAAIVGDATEGLAANKTAGAAEIGTTPYYVWYPINLSVSLTGAGVLINTQAQVTYADGTPIPNLYAAGELTGGVMYDQYFHGHNHCRATVLGRIAGQECAAAL